MGYNSRQVTVKKGSSYRYLDVTVRCSEVDLNVVDEFFKDLDTWEMDMADYCTGQSFTLHVSEDVKIAKTLSIKKQCDAFYDCPKPTTILYTTHEGGDLSVDLIPVDESDVEYQGGTSVRFAGDGRIYHLDYYDKLEFAMVVLGYLEKTKLLTFEKLVKSVEKADGSQIRMDGAFVGIFERDTDYKVNFDWSDDIYIVKKNAVIRQQNTIAFITIEPCGMDKQPFPVKISVMTECTPSMFKP